VDYTNEFCSPLLSFAWRRTDPFDRTIGEAGNKMIVPLLRFGIDDPEAACHSIQIAATTALAPHEADIGNLRLVLGRLVLLFFPSQTGGIWRRKFGSLLKTAR